MKSGKTKSVWPYWVLAIGAFLILGAAAVWMGGLNQDEGWYLYAAQMVNDGLMPYRDFAYTQGPLMPLVYSGFVRVWQSGGLLAARILTACIGLFALLFAVMLARLSVAPERRDAAGLLAFLLLGVNLYHLYYTSIPKTYALASLFVLMGFVWLALSSEGRPGRLRPFVLALAGLSLSFAAGTRISLGALLAVVGCSLLFSFRTRRWDFVWFGLGGVFGLALVYGPFLVDDAARAGLVAAQRYHAARGGFDPVFTVGSFSRLVRWYLPLFILLGLGVAGLVANRDARRETRHANVLLWGFAAVFFVQMLAPFPYEDYQVPVMGLLAVYAAVTFVSSPTFNLQPSTFSLLLALGLAFATAFGSPLLEKWTTNGQDRFWSRKKGATELAQLRDAARRIEQFDPGGKTLLTQDTYLAIETGRRVPKGLEMGPFSMLSDAQWRALLESAPCPLAAVSGYTFAIEPPVCSERPIGEQLDYMKILKRNYSAVDQIYDFGQNATTLLLLKRNAKE